MSIKNKYNASGFSESEETTFKSYNLNGCAAACIVQGLIEAMRYWRKESENMERKADEREFAKEKMGEHERALRAFDRETMKGK